jgi:unspecific monooxygenase
VLFERLPGLRIQEPPRARDAWHFRGLEALRIGW